MLTSDAGPYPFELRPGLRYRRLPDRPAWASDLHLDLLIPHTPPGRQTPAVLYFHGGAWAGGGRELGLYPWIGPLLTANGILSASVDYRLTTSDPFPAQLEDALAAVRWLRANAISYGADPNRIGVWGDSAGGHLALLLATGDPDDAAAVQAVVARCGPSDFRAWHLDDEDEPGSVFYRLFGGPNSRSHGQRAAASPAARLHDDLPPVLLQHGDLDETVPYEQSLQFAERVRRLGGQIRLDTVSGGHHNMTSDEAAPWTDKPWTALGRDALAFFLEQLA